MKAIELRKFIDDHELPVARAAEILGVDRKTLDRWLADERDIPPSIGTECRLLAGRARLYQLRPLPEQADAVHWRASSHQATITVRAPSSRTARQFAALRYGRSARRGSEGGEAPRIPWLDRELVECVPIRASRAIPADGPFGIVDGPA